MEERIMGGRGEGEDVNVKIKAPKRILHFSDGILEEYSDDETDATPPNETNVIIDPKTLTWGPWLTYKAWSMGSTALAVCDYLGEGLASFLGITTPKYWFELEEYKRMEDEKRKMQEQAEGWSEPAPSNSFNLQTIQTNQPTMPNVNIC